VTKATDPQPVPRSEHATDDHAALWQAAAPPAPALHGLAAALEALPLEERFATLCRLAHAPSVFQRLAAYRWLAGLYLLDLRFEQRAKRVIAGALAREEGLARSRVKELLKRC
jgi:hypothetical protein